TRFSRDWSSDVCSSDLRLSRFFSAWNTRLAEDAPEVQTTGQAVDLLLLEGQLVYEQRLLERAEREREEIESLLPFAEELAQLLKIGRASCRERGSSSWA